MPANTDPRLSVPAPGRNYFYRRSLGPRETLSAVGIGVAAGALAFYVARVLLERTPLIEPEKAPRPPRRAGARAVVRESRG